MTNQHLVPTNMDVLIQTERISKIFTDTIYRIELVLCLPLLLAEDCKLLRRWFTKETITFIQHTCNKYKEQVLTNEKTRVEASDEIKSFSSSLSEEIQVQDNVFLSAITEQLESKHVIQRNQDPDMCRVINTIFGSFEVRNYCKENLIQQVSPAGSKFLNSLKEFYQLVYENLKISPEQEAKNEMELACLYQQNQRYKQEIEMLEQKLQEQTEESENTITEIRELSKYEMDKIHEIRNQCKQSILKRIDEANKQINWEMKNSEYRQEILQSGLKNSQARQETQLKDNLANEKEMRIKRYKIESQLVALLEKYDNDIGERQTQLEEMTDAFHKEQKQMQELQEKFDLQEIEYKNLMMEKEAYERQVWEAKLYEIKCKIAARKIQRFYRQYLATCKTKGKKGKGKGKKKK